MVIDGFTVFGSWPGLSHDYSVAEVIDGLTRHKVDRACTLSSRGIFFDATEGNRSTLEACKQDARLIPIGVADPRAQGEQQVVACAEAGIRMMAMFPASQGWALESLSTLRVLEHLAAVRLPVMIEAGHRGNATAIMQVTEGLDLPVILLAAEPTTLAETIAVLQARANTYVSTRLLCGGDTIQYLAQAVGVDRLIFSSRFPVSCFSSAFLTAKFADITDADRTAILGGNLQRLLAVSPG
jgi:uncharacterized protein